MTSLVTNAGVGSGNDFESIISASVTQKKRQLTSRVTKRKSEAEIEKDGINSLKSALKSFQESCKTLTEKNSMNTHKVTTSESKDYDCFSITTEKDAVNTNFSLQVSQLAKAESVSQKFKTSDGFNNSFQAGKITIDLGEEEYKDDKGQTQTRERKFTVDIAEGDSIEMIRKKLNENDFDVNVNLVKTDDGYSFNVTSGSTGYNSSNLTITTETSGAADAGKDSLSAFNFNPATDIDSTTDANGDITETANSNSKWTYNQGKDCVVYVDGNKVSNHTNTFDDNQIAGLKLEVYKLSENETINGVTGLKTYDVDVTTDEDAAKDKMQSFVNSYNSLMSTMDKLYNRNTYTDGKNNYDGGDLAGDSQLKSIQTTLQSMVVRFTKESTGKTIFDCGLSFNKDGTLSLDSTEFKKSIDNSFNSVVSLFTDDGGLVDQLSDFVDDYTKTGGLLQERLDNVQKEIDSWTQKESDNEEKLEKYEASLRQKYANLDSLMSNYNTSLSYISNILGQDLNNKKRLSSIAQTFFVLIFL